MMPQIDHPKRNQLLTISFCQLPDGFNETLWADVSSEGLIEDKT